MGDNSVEIRRITIEVVPFAAPKILSFWFEPADVINRGQCVDSQWHVDGRVNTVAVYRNGSFFVESADDAGSTWDCLASNGFYTYTLKAYGPGGVEETTRTLEVR